MAESLHCKSHDIRQDHSIPTPLSSDFDHHYLLSTACQILDCTFFATCYNLCRRSSSPRSLPTSASPSPPWSISRRVRRTRAMTQIHRGSSQYLKVKLHMISAIPLLRLPIKLPLLKLVQGSLAHGRSASARNSVESLFTSRQVGSA